MFKKNLLILSLMFLSGCAGITTTTQQEEVDGLKVYNYFVVADTIAGMCPISDENLKTKHKINFQKITQSAYENYRKIAPKISENAVEHWIETAQNKLTRSAKALVVKAGCDHPGVLNELNIYIRQANWDRNENYADHINKPINTLPMYGGLFKNEAMLKADKEFVQYAKNRGFTRERAAKHYLMRAWEAVKEKNLKIAMKRFNQAWLLDPEDGDIYWGYGVLSDQMKRPFKESEKYFLMALDKERGSPRRYSDYGWFLISHKRLEEAKRLLKTGLEKDPTTFNARSNLAFIAYLEKDYLAACTLAKQAKVNGDFLEKGFLADMCQ
ncbi:MAG: tetratricopeptide repeat protein [Terasakiella sp.]